MTESIGRKLILSKYTKFYYGDSVFIYNDTFDYSNCQKIVSKGNTSKNHRSLCYNSEVKKCLTDQWTDLKFVLLSHVVNCICRLVVQH